MAILRDCCELTRGDVEDAAVEVEAAVANVVTDPQVPQAVQEQHVGVRADKGKWENGAVGIGTAS